MVGARAATQSTFAQPLPGRANYLIGDDRAKWHTGVQRFGQVRFPQVLDGVDLAYYGRGRRLEYDFIVQAGTDPSHIALRASGTDAINVSASGDLVLSAGGIDVSFSRPVAYQTYAGQRREVPARFVMRGPGEVGFDIGGYDRTRPLVIDPVLSYATYLGGSSEDAATSVAVGADGRIYVAGYTSSVDFPSAGTNSPIQGFTDGFVAKLSADGSVLEYVTYLGGSDYDFAYGIGVDSSGNAYVAGTSFSSDFPPGGPIFGFAFVASLDQAGSAMGYAKRIPGSLTSVAFAVSEEGTAVLAGTTGSSSGPFATQAAFQPTLNSIGSPNDAFVMRFDRSGAVVYATLLGGDGDEFPTGVAVDAGGNAYVTGWTTSTNLATTGTAAQASLAGSALWTSASSGTTWTGRPLLAAPVVNAFARDPGSNTVLAASRGMTGNDLNADATGLGGAIVSFAASASDAADGSVAVACTPASGSMFAIGVTTVTCAAADAAGNSASRAFTVTIHDVTLPGDMHGGGFLTMSGKRQTFEFDVREQSTGLERGRLSLEILRDEGGDGLASDTDDREDDGCNRFVARGVTFVAFSDDPDFRPSRGRQPLIDTVHFAGAGEWNGRGGYSFEATAIDVGEPGQGRDIFAITIRDGAGAVVAAVSGVLGGGNIQSLRMPPR